MASRSSLQSFKLIHLPPIPLKISGTQKTRKMADRSSGSLLVPMLSVGSSSRLGSERQHKNKLCQSLQKNPWHILKATMEQ